MWICHSPPPFCLWIFLQLQVDRPTPLPLRYSHPSLLRSAQLVSSLSWPASQTPALFPAPVRRSQNAYAQKQRRQRLRGDKSQKIAATRRRGCNFLGGGGEEGVWVALTAPLFVVSRDDRLVGEAGGGWQAHWPLVGHLSGGIAEQWRSQLPVSWSSNPQGGTGGLTLMRKILMGVPTNSQPWILRGDPAVRTELERVEEDVFSPPHHFNQLTTVFFVGARFSSSVCGSARRSSC